MQRHIDFSPPSSSTIKKLCCSLPYGSSSSKMSQIILIFACLAVTVEYASAEYPENFHAGRRRQLSAASPDEKQYLIEQLSNFIDQQARRKFQQQLQMGHLHQKQQQQMQVPQEITGPGFSFELPPITKMGAELNDNDEPIQFAVQPFDSRYYEQSLPQDDEEIAIDEAPQEPLTTPKSNFLESVVGKNKILIPSPMHILESSQASGETQSRILHRAQQKQQQLLKQSASDVSQKPLQVEFDHSMNLYLVALIAGISCAFSTGLIALGLMYWTLKKKVKSADACDYASCDYGVVGPRLKNADPQVAAGDKKLAHSAQMFHYQHQKNQIIAMENRNGAEISHNDEDNDSDENENDFTVYECPGLAGVGQNMEVKNPLFTEDQTPATTKTEKSQATSKTTK